MFPCDILPTNDLLVHIKKRVVPVSHAMTTSTSTTSSTWSPVIAPQYIVYPPLDETTGLTILNYIYESESLFQSKNQMIQQAPTSSGSFFGLGFLRGATSQVVPKENPSLIDQGKLLYSLYPRKDNISQIDKYFLMKHNMSINILILDCNVPITNLRAAGIITSYEDLCDLGFEPQDLNINRELFNVGHMVQLFKMNATSMDFGLEELLTCKFCPADLLTLQFSLPGLIEDRGIQAKHLKALNYSLPDLMSLGFNRSHLQLLNINPTQMGWAPRDVNQL